MIWPMKAGSVLLGRGAAEATDQGVRRGADEVEGDEAGYYFLHANPPFTLRHLPHANQTR